MTDANRTLDLTDPKDYLHHYLNRAREAMLWKLEGLGEYDLRRPLTPTGTNLLGLVKHLAAIDAGYFGDCFGRPFPDPPAYFEYEGGEPNADMWATPDETSQFITDLYRRACAHSDAAIDALHLDAPGRVPWWSDDRADVTLHQILVHMIAETNRHAGHADIIRETIDGAAGMRPDATNLWAEDDPDYWTDYHAKLEQAARQAAGR